MAEITIRIEGMSCQHCVLSVQQALNKVDGVNSSEVTVGSAAVQYDEGKQIPRKLCGRLKRPDTRLADKQWRTGFRKLSFVP